MIIHFHNHFNILCTAKSQNTSVFLKTELYNTLPGLEVLPKERNTFLSEKIHEFLQLFPKVSKYILFPHRNVLHLVLHVYVNQESKIKEIKLKKKLNGNALIFSRASHNVLVQFILRILFSQLFQSQIVSFAIISWIRDDEINYYYKPLLHFFISQWWK